MLDAARPADAGERGASRRTALVEAPVTHAGRNRSRARVDRGRRVRHALTLKINPSNVFVAFTDGVNEARNDADEEFGEHGCLDVIESARHLGAAESARRC